MTYNCVFIVPAICSEGILVELIIVCHNVTGNQWNFTEIVQVQQQLDRDDVIGIKLKKRNWITKHEVQIIQQECVGS